MVRWLSLALLTAAVSSVHAQPVDPYAEPQKPASAPPVLVPKPAPAPAAPSSAWGQAPAPAPAPTNAQDPILAEQVAISLVDRAQELIEAKIYVDAKQLAVEAIVRSPNGPAADRARALIKQANAALGIAEPAPPPIDVKVTTEKTDPEELPVPKDTTEHSGKTAAMVHGGLYLGTVGAMIGSFFSSNEAAGAVPMGIGFGALGALIGPAVAKHYHADEAQVRTIGAGTVWGGTIGGFIGATVQGADGGHVNGSGVLVGATIGSSLGILGTVGLAQDHKFTRGDVALVDTFAGTGALGGLTVGMLMQPAQREAYTLNAALGAGAGLVVGYIAAPQTNTTPRRMIRVAGLTLAGGALPFLLYAGIHDKHGTWDERLTGGLSSLGLVGGTVLGFYLTRHVDEGMDVPEGATKKADPDDAPLAVIGRSSAGKWDLGGVGVTPLSTTLVTGAPQRGMAVSLVGATF